MHLRLILKDKLALSDFDSTVFPRHSFITGVARLFCLRAKFHLRYCFAGCKKNFGMFFTQKCFFRQNVTKKTAEKAFVQKRSSKMLMKLTLGWESLDHRVLGLCKSFQFSIHRVTPLKYQIPILLFISCYINQLDNTELRFL